MTDLNLPPYGEIPDDVRNRVRDKVQQRIRKPKRGVPIAVAAGVALLATAAVVVTTRSEASVAPAQAQNEYDLAMDRCWAAVERSGKTDVYPPRSTWRLTRALTASELVVVGMITPSSPKSPFFCQTTPATVTMSKPGATLRYAEGVRAAALLATDNGILAGVVETTWPAAYLAGPEGGPMALDADRGTGAFIAPSRGDSTSKLTIGWSQDPYAQPPQTHSSLPQAPTPEIDMVDRPWPAPPSDRCTLHAGFALPPQSAYGSSAVIRQDKSLLIVTRGTARLGVCATDRLDNLESTAAFKAGPPVFDLQPDEPLAFSTGLFGAKTTIGGAVPMSTARMQIEFANGVKAEPVVSNGTFAVIIPDGVPLDPARKDRPAVAATAKLLDAAGATIYSGTLRHWDPPK
ncbi:hypothetical protein [Kibdelosporangium phytohabitans]|uniref:Uncharacterized protein n=1 Tax=Kibdelosporangium phytohabitans TaxID=860235 RepID=A0A0N9IFJ6_9PSEU|nr:hypothetical protein [Kibdelosporangium phytohabitans]ALG14050.1 hypothetical protein AOZ06_50685 [Kibdelosporangium phytohabitans]MBE1466986.1 hypothetical protein [Kibdelosporangium phytohabitans]